MGVEAGADAVDACWSCETELKGFNYSDSSTYYLAKGAHMVLNSDYYYKGIGNFLHNIFPLYP